MRRRTAVRLTALVLLVIALASLDVLVDRPFRAWLLREANERLDGYVLALGPVDLRPWSLAWRLEDVRIIQEAHPEPAVAELPVLELSVAWRALLRGRLVADARFERPQLHVDIEHLREERADDRPLDERGWQDVVALYPLTIDRLAIDDGSFTYLAASGEGAAEPRRLRLTDVMLDARNIRHVVDGGDPFPSPIRLTATVFEDGRLSADGRMDLLRKPHAALTLDAALSNVPLAALGLLSERYHLSLHGGTVTAEGHVELTPERLVARLGKAVIEGVELEYTSAEDDVAERAARAVAEAARATGREREVRWEVADLRLDGRVAYRNATEDPVYRLFVDDVALSVTGLDGEPGGPPAALEATGLFMGSGATRLRGAFQPGAEAADFALDLQVTNTELSALNDLLRAHGKLDTTGGRLSLYSQLRVREGRIDGYVKPLFRDVEIYDPAQDADENVFQRLYEGIAEQIAKILENQPRDEVATVTDLSGPLDNPDASLWQIVGNLLRNAFVQAILPGFDREARG